ncbi:Hypothetical protein PHPALM_18496, partial [Phytophthora palmivora]
MRTTRREKHTNPAAPATAAHDLRAVGWTSKRPTGIQTDWTYTSSNNDVLVGERAVVEYAFQYGLLVDDDDDSAGAAADTDEHVADEHKGEEGSGGGEGGGSNGGIDDATIRPSLIDTSVLLTQLTRYLAQAPIHHRLSYTESQNAVTRAFDLSQRDFDAAEELRDVAANLHLLTGASGMESKEEDERVGAPPPAPLRRHQIPAKPNADVNVLQDGEINSEYEDFSSGDESDDTAIADDDHDCIGNEFGVEGDQISDSDAEEMDQAFLASLHVGDNALSKAALQESEKALRAMEWTAPSAAFETDKTPYPGLGAEEARP